MFLNINFLYEFKYQNLAAFYAYSLSWSSSWILFLMFSYLYVFSVSSYNIFYLDFSKNSLLTIDFCLMDPRSLYHALSNMLILLIPASLMVLIGIQDTAFLMTPDENAVKPAIAPFTAFYANFEHIIVSSPLAATDLIA